MFADQGMHSEISNFAPWLPRAATNSNIFCSDRPCLCNFCYLGNIFRKIQILVLFPCSEKPPPLTEPVQNLEFPGQTISNRFFSYFSDFISYFKNSFPHLYSSFSYIPNFFPISIIFFLYP